MKRFAKMIRFLFSFLLFLSSIGVFITNRMMYIKKKDDETILKSRKIVIRSIPTRRFSSSTQKRHNSTFSVWI